MTFDRTTLVVGASVVVVDVDGREDAIACQRIAAIFCASIVIVACARHENALGRFIVAHIECASIAVAALDNLDVVTLARRRYALVFRAFVAIVAVARSDNNADAFDALGHFAKQVGVSDNHLVEACASRHLAHVLGAIESIKAIAVRFTAIALRRRHARVREQIARKRNALVCQRAVFVLAATTINQRMLAISIDTNAIQCAWIEVVAIFVHRNALAIVRIARRYVAQIGRRWAELLLFHAVARVWIAHCHEARIIWLLARLRIAEAFAFFTTMIDCAQRRMFGAIAWLAHTAAHWIALVDQTFVSAVAVAIGKHNADARFAMGRLARMWRLDEDRPFDTAERRITECLVTFVRRRALDVGVHALVHRDVAERFFATIARVAIEWL